MRLLSLCSGFGGLDLAVGAALDCETVAFAEIDAKAASVFARHWPDVPNLGDLTAVDWSAWADVDVVTAGFPCQDLSYAGKGAGIVKDSRSGLWYAIEHALGVLRPRLVVLENVAAIVARRPGLDVVLAGLARLGFDARWTCLRAADVGAPHGRKRWFLVAADAGSERHGGSPVGTRAGRVGSLDREAATGARQRQRARQESGDRGAAAPADPTGVGRAEGRTGADGRRAATRSANALADAAGDTGWLCDGDSQTPADADQPSGEALHGRPGTGDAGRSQPVERGGAAPADAECSGRDGGAPEQGWREVQRVAAARRSQVDWGDYTPAIRRWEAVIGRPAPAPTDERGRLSPHLVEWMMGLPAGWVTDTPGLSRADMLKILGNGVLPAQAAAAIRSLLFARDVAA